MYLHIFFIFSTSSGGFRTNYRDQPSYTSSATRHARSRVEVPMLVILAGLTVSLFYTLWKIAQFESFKFVPDTLVKFKRSSKQTYCWFRRKKIEIILFLRLRIWATGTKLCCNLIKLIWLLARNVNSKLLSMPAFFNQNYSYNLDDLFLTGQ